MAGASHACFSVGPHHLESTPPEPWPRRTPNEGERCWCASHPTTWAGEKKQGARKETRNCSDCFSSVPTRPQDTDEPGLTSVTEHVPHANTVQSTLRSATHLVHLLLYKVGIRTTLSIRDAHGGTLRPWWQTVSSADGLIDVSPIPHSLLTK